MVSTALDCMEQSPSEKAEKLDLLTEYLATDAVWYVYMPLDGAFYTCSLAF